MSKRIARLKSDLTCAMSQREKKKKKCVAKLGSAHETDIAALAVLFAFFVVNFSLPALFWVSVFTFFHPKPPLGLLLPSTLFFQKRVIRHEG